MADFVIVHSNIHYGATKITEHYRDYEGIYIGTQSINCVCLGNTVLYARTISYPGASKQIEIGTYGLEEQANANIFVDASRQSGFLKNSAEKTGGIGDYDKTKTYTSDNNLIEIKLRMKNRQAFVRSNYELSAEGSKFKKDGIIGDFIFNNLLNKLGAGVIYIKQNGNFIKYLENNNTNGFMLPDETNVFNISMANNMEFIRVINSGKCFIIDLSLIIAGLILSIITIPIGLGELTLPWVIACAIGLAGGGVLLGVGIVEMMKLATTNQRSAAQQILDSLTQSKDGWYHQTYTLTCKSGDSPLIIPLGVKYNLSWLNGIPILEGRNRNDVNFPLTVNSYHYDAPTTFFDQFAAIRSFSAKGSMPIPEVHCPSYGDLPNVKINKEYKD